MKFFSRNENLPPGRIKTMSCKYLQKKVPQTMSSAEYGFWMFGCTSAEKWHLWIRVCICSQAIIAASLHRTAQICTAVWIQFHITLQTLCNPSLNPDYPWTRNIEPLRWPIDEPLPWIYFSSWQAGIDDVTRWSSELGYCLWIDWLLSWVSNGELGFLLHDC